ncbi:hypothetical protein LX36DRAFT_245947 [Colletotrichum falcatum]|nr:hypothetical protein LX36DRAFT_245947 [Colletotrichum falcatum]
MAAQDWFRFQGVSKQDLMGPVHSAILSVLMMSWSAAAPVLGLETWGLVDGIEDDPRDVISGPPCRSTHTHPCRALLDRHCTILRTWSEPGPGWRSKGRGRPLATYFVPHSRQLTAATTRRPRSTYEYVLRAQYVRSQVQDFSHASLGCGHLVASRYCVDHPKLHWASCMAVKFRRQRHRRRE